MVVGNDAADFCVGANIALVGIAAAQGMWDVLDQQIKNLQTTTMRLKHAPKPVVTAPTGRTLGGGVEMTMGSLSTSRRTLALRTPRSSEAMSSWKKLSQSTPGRMNTATMLKIQTYLMLPFGVSNFCVLSKCTSVMG